MRGGKRPGAGRKPGEVTKAKRELAEMAKDHAEAALDTLVSIHKNSDQPASARVAAASAILDRGYGKPPQSLEHTGKDGKDLIPDKSPREIARAFLSVLSKASVTSDDSDDSGRPSAD